LEKDPRETKNVYDDPAYADIKRRLEVELTRLQAHYLDSEELARELVRKDLKK